MTTTTAPTYASFIESNDVFDDPVGLNRRLDEHGYLCFRGKGPKDLILQAKQDILKICQDAGWAKTGANLKDPIWTGAGPFGEGDPEYMAVYKNVLRLPSFSGLPEDPVLMALMGRILGGEVLLHRRKIGRITFPKNTSQATPAHQDFMYIRGTPRTYTLWMPIGDCPTELGGLAVLSGSHRAGYIEHKTFPGHKYAGSGVAEEDMPREGTEWHAGDFKVGDFLVFHSHNIHKALPNVTPDRLRFSCDNRYQRKDEEMGPGAMGTHHNL